MPGSDWESDGEENPSSSVMNSSGLMTQGVINTLRLIFYTTTSLGHKKQPDAAYDQSSNLNDFPGFGSERGFGNRQENRGRDGSGMFGRGFGSKEDGQQRSGFSERRGFQKRNNFGDEGRSGFSGTRRFGRNDNVDNEGANGNADFQKCSWNPTQSGKIANENPTSNWIPKGGKNADENQTSNWIPKGKNADENQTSNWIPKGFRSEEERPRRRGGFNENSEFGARGRRGRGSNSGDGDGSERQGFGGDGFAKRGFGGRGGFRGNNEEIDFEAAKGAVMGNDVADQVPRVTYIPPPPPETEDAIFKHYQTGINFDKYDDILVDVSGVDAPPAILTFEEANLCDTLNKNIFKAGYVKLTPIQKYSIPIVMAGRDLMACAQTGSGKTAAFLLPILAYMMNEGITSSSFKELQEPEAIIVAPTRELINQIYLDARKFAYGTCVRPVVIYGGTQTGHSLRQIFQGCNILCATPGRLMDVIGKEKIGLGKVKFLVLDEADRMLDMGFGPEIAKLVTSPNMPSKEDRQTLMFSATFPKEIQNLASNHLKRNYLFVVVGQVGGACSDVEQSILEISQFQKREKLLEILNNIGNERTMVFVKTKKSADFIASFLCQQSINTTSIHGDREQREREIALFDFRSGKCSVLAATSVAARGLDIENVQHVINFDLPKDIDEYVHRIGRTGRCGNTGKAISFFDTQNQEDVGIARSLVKVLTDAHQEVPPFLEEIAYNAHGTSGYNPHGNVFASVDSRKRGVQESIPSTGFAADEEEIWG